MKKERKIEIPNPLPIDSDKQGYRILAELVAQITAEMEVILPEIKKINRYYIFSEEEGRRQNLGGACIQHGRGNAATYSIAICQISLASFPRAYQVLIHEFAHTRFMVHDDNFYALVGKMYEIHYKSLIKLGI